MNFIKLLIVLGFKANNQVIPNTRVVVFDVHHHTRGS
jgi:hypothetical protein